MDPESSRMTSPSPVPLLMKQILADHVRIKGFSIASELKSEKDLISFSGQSRSTPGPWFSSVFPT